MANVGSKVAGTVKEHPYTTAATAAAAAAGLGILITRGLRKGAESGSKGGQSEEDEGQDSSMSGEDDEDEGDDEGEGDDDSGEDESADDDDSSGGGAKMSNDEGEEDEDEDEGEEEGESEEDEGESDSGEEDDDSERSDDDDDEEDDDQRSGGRGFRGQISEGLSSLGRYGRNGFSRVGEALRGGAEAVGGGARGGAEAVGRGARDSAEALGRSARTGFNRGRRVADRSWQGHPLAMCLAALAAGAALGMMLPWTSAEDSLMGETSDKLTGRAKEAGQELWGQGKAIASRVIQEAVDTTAREIEKEGLNPDRIGRKVKRVASQVRDAVANAVQDE